MASSFDFSGKVCVVSGGASGLGEGVIRKLAFSAAHVFIADLNLTAAEALAEELRADGKRAHAVFLDCTKPETIRRAVQDILKQVPKIDCLVNSMGIGAKAREGESFSDTYNRVMAVNLGGIFNSCHVFVEEMIKTGGGTVVNIASQAATIVPAKTRPGRGGEYGLIGYCTSKAGVKHMTRAMATLWAAYGIRANSVSPGYVDTPLTAEPHSDPVIRADMISKVPLKRIASPDDIAGTVAFLLSDESSYLTAQDIIVDGGYTAL